MTHDNATPEMRIYVSTYAKYVAGSLKGGWLDPSAFDDHEAFLAECRVLHPDEADPEFMFQACEGIPKGYVGEASVSPALWDWLALDEEDRTLLRIYRAAHDPEADIDAARDALVGRATSGAAYAEELAEECGQLEGLPSCIQGHIDWAGVWRDMTADGYFFAIDEEDYSDDGYVFFPS